MAIFTPLQAIKWDRPIVDPATGCLKPDVQRLFQQLFSNGDYLEANKQDQDADLDALAALATAGYAIRTGAGTWTTRAVTVTVGHLSISNGDGVAAAVTRPCASMVTSAFV